MKVRRLVASVSASFEQFVNKVENHEAVAESVIRDVRAGAAKLKVQLARIESETRRLDTRRAGLEEEAQRWRDRATRLAQDGSDDDKARECLRRMQRASAQARHASEQIESHEALAVELKARLEEIESRLGDLQLRRSALTSREVRARANAVGCDSSGDVDDVFDRWEMAVVEDEYRDDIVSVDGSDRLQREFDAAEESEDLDAMLRELRAGGES